MLTKYINHLPVDGRVTYKVLSKLLDSSSWKLTKAKDINPGDIIVDDFASHYVESVDWNEFEIVFHFSQDGIKRALKGDTLRVIPAKDISLQIGKQLK